MDTSILEDLGLTNSEIKVYIALLELGTTTAGPILDKTGLQNSVVHMTLHKLLEKGLISYIKKGKIRHYSATDPHNIIKFIDEKKKKFQELLPELLVRQKRQEMQEAEVYEGFKGFKAMNYEALNDVKKGDEWLFFGFSTENLKNQERIFDFYKDFEKERLKCGLVIKGIVAEAYKPKLKARKQETLQYVDYPTISNVTILNDKVLLTASEDETVCFLIRSRQLAESFRKYFYSIWNKKK